jgi:hypothetical protein
LTKRTNLIEQRLALLRLLVEISNKIKEIDRILAEEATNHEKK